MKVGSLGTLHTLGLAKEKGARYLLASTSESYGDPLVHPQPETYWGNVNPVGPRSCYDEAKRFAEALTTSYRTTHGVNTAIMRIFNTYGPRMRPNDGRAIPNFISQALSGAPITVQGDGSQTRSVCHVDDLVEGALAAAVLRPRGSGQHRQSARNDHPGAGGSGPRAHRIRLCARVHRTRRRMIRRSVSPTSLSRARELQWEPKVDVRDGLLETIAWFRDTVDGIARRLAGTR